MYIRIQVFYASCWSSKTELLCSFCFVKLLAKFIVISKRLNTKLILKLTFSSFSHLFVSRTNDFCICSSFIRILCFDTELFISY